MYLKCTVNHMATQKFYFIKMIAWSDTVYHLQVHCGKDNKHIIQKPVKTWSKTACINSNSSLAFGFSILPEVYMKLLGLISYCKLTDINIKATCICLFLQRPSQIFVLIKLVFIFHVLWIGKTSMLPKIYISFSQSSKWVQWPKNHRNLYKEEKSTHTITVNIYQNHIQEPFSFFIRYKFLFMIIRCAIQ